MIDPGMILKMRILTWGQRLVAICIVFGCERQDERGVGRQVEPEQDVVVHVSAVRDRLAVKRNLADTLGADGKREAGYRACSGIGDCELPDGLSPDRHAIHQQHVVRELGQRRDPEQALLFAVGDELEIAVNPGVGFPGDVREVPVRDEPFGLAGLITVDRGVLGGEVEVEDVDAALPDEVRDAAGLRCMSRWLLSLITQAGQRYIGRAWPKMLRRGWV